MDSRYAVCNTHANQRRPTTASATSHNRPGPSPYTPTASLPGLDRRALAPVASGQSDGSTPPALPPRLRPSRSATNLSGFDSRHRGPYYDVSQPPPLPVGFIVDDVPPPAYQLRAPTTQAPGNASLAPPTYRDREIRRVKSSSDVNAPPTSSRLDAGSQLLPDAADKQPSAWKKALGEAQYFAGGLVSRPAESTKHYTVIRHSHALIWYRGPATSVTISILSDAPLPPTRSVWLQQRGHSGNMGMTLKAIVGSSKSWIDVTPATKAVATDLPAVDERGIQRDLKRFWKRASGRQQKHLPRETHLVRIPAACEDGYFRLVLCSGSEDERKVLCGSPVFRVASTSTDISVVRGASLSTMPLEMGIKVASTIGQQWAKRYTGVASAVVQSRAGKLVTNKAVQKAGQKAYKSYQITGMGDAVNESWKTSRAAQYEAALGSAMLQAPIGVIGDENGPSSPFPVKFDGTVVHGSGASTQLLGFPTANLSGVPDAVKARFSGVFAAWACIRPDKESQQRDISTDWHEAVVTIGAANTAAPSVAVKTKVAVHIINDFDEAVFSGSRVKVLLMGYLHECHRTPLDETSAEEYLETHASDVTITVASLGRDNWTSHETLNRMRTLKSERSWSQRLDGVTGRVAEQVDRVPVHWAGVRSESSLLRDKTHGIGGLWIER